MKVTIGNADKEMGKKSAAVRTKLIERTTQCEAIAMSRTVCAGTGSSSNG